MINVTSVQMSLPEQLSSLLCQAKHNVENKALVVLLPATLRENASYNRFQTWLALFDTDFYRLS